MCAFVLVAIVYYSFNYYHITQQLMENHDKKPIEYNQSMFGKLFDLSDYNDLSGTIDVDELVSMVELDTQRVACFLFYYCVVLLGAVLWHTIVYLLQLPCTGTCRKKYTPLCVPWYCCMCVCGQCFSCNF